MKAIYKNIALAALALSAVACTQDEDLSSSFLNDPDAVRITAQVASGNVTGGFTRSNPLGTAAEQAKFNGGDKIAVTANGQAVVTYTFDGTTWTPETGKYLKWVADEMTFTAWYPVGKNNASATTFNVPTEYTEESPIAAADYMVYTGTKNNTNGNGVTLPMERKMARIVITPILNDEFAEGYSITGIKVHANTSGYANGEPQTGSIQVSALKQDDVYYALLAPTTTDNATTFLTVTVTDGTTPKDLIVKGIPTTEAGKSYKFALTVGKNKATIGSVAVKSWTDGTPIADGEKAKEIACCNLPNGTTFKMAILNVLPDDKSVQVIRFVAGSSADDTSDFNPDYTYKMPANAKYKIIGATAPKTLEIHTTAEVFMFNASCYKMFDGGQSEPNELSKITTIDFGNCVNTSNVTSMGEMFAGCGELTSLDLSSFKFKNNVSVTDMFYLTGRFSKATKIIVDEDGYNYLKDKSTYISSAYAKYVKPDGVTPWETSTP